MRRTELTRSFLIAIAGLAFYSGPAGADDQPIAIAEIKRDTPVDFEREILPLLKRSCLACHNATVKESQLIMETPATILKGGDSGPAVVPKNSAESLLLGRATGAVDSIMPPKDNKVAAPRLKPEELGLIKLWIDQGATGIVTGQADQIQWQSLPPGVNPIYAVAVTPDGQYAACGRANQIFIYHLPTGRFVCKLTDPELLKSGVYQKPGVADLDLIQSLAFSADGSMLASGGYRTIKLWRRPRDVRAATFEAASAEAVGSVAVSPDGKWLATAAADNSIKLWDLATGQAAKTLAGHTAPVTGVRFLANSAKLVSTSADKSLRVWNVADGAAAGRIDTPNALQALTLVGDGSLVATGGADNFIRIWKTPAAAAQALAGLPAPATVLAVSPDKKLLAIAGAEGPIQLVDLATGQVAKTLAGHAGAVTSLAFQANGAKLASAGADKTVRIWDVAAGQVVVKLESGVAAPETVALHPGGNQAASGYADGTLAIWKLDAAAPRPLPGPGEGGTDEAAATVAAVSRDGKLLASAGLAGGKPAILVRDLAAGTIVKTLLGHDAVITALAFSADGTRLASGSEDKTARVWNLADGAALGKFAGHTQTVTGVAFDSTGGQVVSGSADNSLKLWNVADGAELKNFAGHTGAIVAVAMTSNNARVISASADQTVRTWNPADGAQASAISPGAVVTALALARDDNRIAVALADNSISCSRSVTARPWPLWRGTPRRCECWHSAPTTFGSFRALATSGPSYGTSPARLLWKACRSKAGWASASSPRAATSWSWGAATSWFASIHCTSSVRFWAMRSGSAAWSTAWTEG